MRSAYLTGLVLLGVSSLAQAQLLASDDFSVAGPLTTNGWVAHSGAGNKVILSDGNVATLEQSSGSGEDIHLLFAPQAASDTTYAGFDLTLPAGNPVNPDANGMYFFHFKDTGIAFRARTGVLSPAGGGDYALAIHADSSNLGAGASWPTDLLFDRTYRVVLSWDAATGTSELWLDPSAASSASITSVGNSTGSLIESLALRQGSDYTGFMTIDNVAAGRTFADVLGTVLPPNSGSAYCFGDGSGATCPCSDFGATGEGCANSSGLGATLSGSGSASFTNDTLTLDVAGVNGDRPGLLLRADNQIVSPAGNGLICLTGNSMRSAVHMTSAGMTTFTEFQSGVSLASVANPSAATQFQYWYRDDTTGPCTTSGFNFTNAWSVTYLP